MIPRRAFTFLRHGEADWNVERRCIGQLDRPLTARGRAQAEAARVLCAGLAISEIVHSPLSRAAETAAIVSGGGLWRLRPEAGLMEAHLGDYQGVVEDEPHVYSIRGWVGGQQIPGAETYAALKERVATAVTAILDSMPSGAPPLLVAHAGVYHALRDVMGLPIGLVKHCVPYVHEPDAGAWRIRELA